MLAPWPTSRSPLAGATRRSRLPRVPDFQIVPLRGLPIVAAVFVALIAAIAANKLWALEFFHVASGAVWTSMDLFLGLVLGPILGRLTIPARVELTTRLMPKILLIMPTVVDRDARRRAGSSAAISARSTATTASTAGSSPPTSWSGSWP